MEKNGWQILAIIFMILTALLFIILIFETLFVILYLAVEADLDSKEVKCDMNICGQYENYTSYTFDEYSEVCYCYDSVGELIHQEFVELEY